jgi:hypothetical protein
MPRTLDGVAVHSTQMAQFHIKLFVTPDGHAEAFAGITPQDAHDKGFAWMQTLPPRGEVVITDLEPAPSAAHVVDPAPKATRGKKTKADASEEAVSP